MKAGSATPAVAGVLAGTSGFAFSEWKPGFYPRDLKADRMLGYYGERLPTVEVNASFYRMPTSKMLADWKAQTPAQFRFAMKAHRMITHIKRLRDVDEQVRWLHDRFTELGDRLGPVLFQLPPSLRGDVGLLEQFLATLRPLPYVAMEFRHPTWFADPVYEVLRRYRAALCTAEDDESCDPVVATAPFAYYRLHRLRYNDAQLAAWAQRLQAQAGNGPVFCYFTHETGPEAVEYAQMLMRLAGREHGTAAQPVAPGEEGKTSV